MIFNSTVNSSRRGFVFNTINSKVFQINCFQNNRVCTFSHSNMFKSFTNGKAGSSVIIPDANSDILGVSFRLFNLIHRNSPVNFAYILTIFNGTVNGIISNLIFNPINSKGT